MTLFTKDGQPLEYLLGEMKQLSPEFQFWAKTTLGTGWLDKIVYALVLTQKANDKKGALEYLRQLSLQAKLTNLKIAKSDFAGKTSHEPFRLLAQKLGHGPKADLDIYRHYGRVGHQMIGDLLSGAIPNYQKAIEFLKKEGGQLIRPHQYKIFETKPEHSDQLNLFGPELRLGIEFWKEILPGNLISLKLKKDLALILKALTDLILLKQCSNWTDLYDIAWPLIPELETRLAPIFQNHLDALKTDDAFTRFVRLLTMMSWATLIPWMDDQKSPLFKEITVLDSKLGVNGGRVDAIEVMTINNNPPDQAQKELLKKLAKDHYKSIGHLVYTLRQIFGSSLALRITDWKFAIGDGMENSQILQPAKLGELLEKHALQVKNYVTLANLDCHLQYRKGRDPWHKNPYFTQARLVYILPASSPIVHELTIAPAEQKRLFQEELVSKLHLAKKQAVLRHFDNKLVGHTVNLLNGKEKTWPNQSARYPLLFSELEPADGFRQIVNKYRQFADKSEIIEITKHHEKGGNLLLMHLDKLVKLVNFNPESGFISCLMPNHDDSTPSMRIYTERGFFKCFGCGVFGLIADPKSFMDFQKTRIDSPLGKLPELKQVSKIVIPDAQHKIMSLAQQILSQQFIGSPGQTYTQKERHIDSDLARSYGAGYGNDFFIESLLDNYSLDELIYYGFVAISDKVNPRRGLCPLLIKRGLTIKLMRRPINKNFGLPYSTLDQRLTFPLILEGRNTNFYGRATWPACSNRSKHRKLSTKRTEVPQGLFNYPALQSKVVEIVINEGVFDGLSLMQLGWSGIVSIIGVSNYASIEAVARSRKNLAVAFDHDKNQTGQTNTAKVIQYLKKTASPSVVIRNFTEDFMAEHPDFADLGCKDFNEYLIKKFQTA